MPCNLAVTITKAAVTNEQLTKLLTPEIVKTLLETFIGQHPDHQAQTPRATIRKQNGQVSLYISRYDCFLSVINGEVTISTPRYYTEQANDLMKQVALLLSKAADKLFVAQVQQALAKFGNVDAQTTTVDNAGEKQQVRVFTLEL